MPAFTRQTTERLILRAPTVADAAAVFAVYGDPATQSFNPMGAMSSKDAAEHMLWRWQLHWMRHGFGIWAVCLADAPEQVIGFGGAQWNADETALNLHVHLRADALGHGFGAEIGQAAIRVATALPARPTLQASVAAEHVYAQACLAKLGFTSAGGEESLPWLAARVLYRLEAVRPVQASVQYASIARSLALVAEAANRSAADPQLQRNGMAGPVRCAMAA